MQGCECMLKVKFFETDRTYPKKPIDLLENEIFYDHSSAVNFITLIGKENIISISFINRGSSQSACAIFYNDHELLTCPSCTREISDSFDFCPKCGVKLK